MTEGIKTIIYPVKDLAREKALFSRLLGGQPDMDAAYYVGFSVGGQHIGLAPQGHSQGMTGPVGCDIPLGAPALPLPEFLRKSHADA